MPQSPLWLASLGRWMDAGVLERAGSADHPLIVEMIKRVGLAARHDETPWCSAAMNAAVEESGLSGTRRANARSWEAWGERLAEPRFGCIAVLWRGTPNSGQGHVACWLGEVPGGQMALLGGNQHNRVGVSLYPRARLLSFRWPDEECLDEARRPTVRESVRAKAKP
ncbi:MAG TPA: TIGR02594 family protein [Polyangiales bacterium]|nr:TIGR02594 family protein [Polyangiales bacterium]